MHFTGQAATPHCVTAAHDHPWKISDVVIFPLLAAALAAQWFIGSTLGLPRWLGLVLGAPIFISGFWLISRSKRELDAAGQPSLPGEPTTQLVMTGPFARSRNPNYLGALLAGLGGALALGSPWVLLSTALSAVILDIWMIRPEERYLARVFGAEYTAYRQRVRRWF